MEICFGHVQKWNAQGNFSKLFSLQFIKIDNNNNDNEQYENCQFFVVAEIIELDTERPKTIRSMKLECTLQNIVRLSAKHKFGPIKCIQINRMTIGIRIFRNRFSLRAAAQRRRIERASNKSSIHLRN